MFAVKDPDGNAKSALGLAIWANAVHQQNGGKGYPFQVSDYDPSGKSCRLRGYHCNCGVDGNGISNGNFTLLPLLDESVREGGKAYMICERCGAVSHL